MSRRGIAIVHGVGQSRQSDTLIDFGGALLDWVMRAYRAGHPHEAAPRVERSFLPFSPIDAGETAVPHATLHLTRDAQWVCAEAWWGSSIRPISFVSMLLWSFRHLWGLLWHLSLVAVQRLDRMFIPKKHDPNRWTRFIDLLQTLGIIPVFLVGALAGYVLLVPLFIIAQIPYQPLQNFVLVRLFQPFLQYNAADMRLFVEDPIQSANMRRRVAEAVGWLISEGACDDVVILAHSGGAMVSYGFLIDPQYAELAKSVRKLITFGEGLNKAWELAPRPQELATAIPAHISWIDFWSSYDPVPAGWLDPPRKPDTADRRPFGVGIDRRPWCEIYRPNAAVIAREGLTPRVTPNPIEPAPPENTLQRLAARVLRSEAPTAWHDPRPALYWPESIQVTNKMSVLADHDGYLRNDEQVVRRIAAEVDQDDHKQSPFWAPDDVLKRGSVRRRNRVSLLALGRVAGVATAIGAAARWALEAATALMATGLLGVVIGWFASLHNVVILAPAPFGSVGGNIVLFLAAILVSVVGAAAVALAALLPYWIFAQVWSRWDADERERYTRRVLGV